MRACSIVRSRARRAVEAGVVGALMLGAVVAPPSVAVGQGVTLGSAGEAARSSEVAFAFDSNDCGPPSTTIPGPPPELIRVGRPMSDSWLMCYVKQDFEGQTYFFERWGEARKATFEGYPVECWNPERRPDFVGPTTEGIVAQVYGWNLDRTQYVRFTYRIQLDGDYINNCGQEILPTP